MLSQEIIFDLGYNYTHHLYQSAFLLRITK